MPTIGSILTTAAPALRTQQSALDVTAHNVGGRLPADDPPPAGASLPLLEP
jgi:hypothetical protein